MPTVISAPSRLPIWSRTANILHEGHPYFGYGRGRFSKDELKELNAYALERGVEMIPGTNTLAHLGTLFRWKHYAQINDTADILLCEDERTYELIEGMISTCAECFTSRVIDINMDEAELLGRGKYHTLHSVQRSLHWLDVSDVRIGGVMPRLIHCAERLEDYVAGKVENIPELEEKLLDVRTPASDSYGVKKYLNYWDRNSRYYAEIVSANVVGTGY